MRAVVRIGVAMFAAGCSGGGGGSSSTGSTGGSTGSGTLTMTGPYSYSGSVSAQAYSVSGGSASQIDVNLRHDSDVVGFTLTVLSGTVATQTYNTADFEHFGLGVSEPQGIDMITDSTDTVTLSISSVSANPAAETDLHGSISATYHGTQPFPDGGQVTGAGTVDGTF